MQRRATYDLSGRVALVTGGSSGSGEAAAQALVDNGARVAVLDLVAHKLGNRVLEMIGDVVRTTDVTLAVARVEAEFGSLDILVCAAGIAQPWQHAAATPDDVWEHVMAVNSTGTFKANRAVLPGMVNRGYGRIINVSSVAGKEGTALAVAYAASKAAVISVTKSIAKDVAATGVLVNCITPGLIKTPMNAVHSAQELNAIIENTPLGRAGSVDEVAALIVFLASDELSFTTGAAFDISGGRSMH
jgi:3-oxoacyl-[acyl-carrier protein] reductase